MKITALMIEPNTQPKKISIDNTLPAPQAAVGGYIEVIRLADGALIVCNEEGKLQGLPVNRILRDDAETKMDTLVGNILILYASEGSSDFSSLPDCMCRKYIQIFYTEDVTIERSAKGNE